MFDVVQAVRDRKAKFEWDEVVSTHGDMRLYLSVFRDAMKFDEVPAMTWRRVEVSASDPDHGKTFDGVRMPATAHELQEIADILECMFLTPKVIDLLWLQASIKFDSIINTQDKAYPNNPSKRTIVAVSDIHRVHHDIEAAIAAAGGDSGFGIIECVGKYWCIIQALLQHGLIEGDEAACNYGWCAKAASGPGITPGVQCWQRPGFSHNKRHWDPSQTIRLMYKWARLVRGDGSQERVFLPDVAGDPALSGLLHHDKGILSYLRQKGVPEPKPEQAADGSIILPEVVMYSGTPPADMTPEQLANFLAVRAPAVS